MTTNNVMIDIETLDTAIDNKAVVVSVGLVRFDPFGDDTWETIEADPDRTEYVILPIAPQIDAGRKVGGNTLLWWMGQMLTGHPNIKEIFSQAKQNPPNTLEGEFDLDLEDHLIWKMKTVVDYLDTDDYLWAKPANFDCPKIASLAEDVGWDFPVPWYQWRCMSGVRTAAQLCGVPRPKFHTKGNQDHHALWDAIEQTLELQGWLRGLSSGLRS